MGLAAALALAVLVAFAFGAVGRRIALRVTRHTRFNWDDLLVDAASGPARLLLGIGTFAGTARMLSLAVPAQQVINQLLRIAALFLFSWAGLRAVRFGADVLAGRMSLGAADGAARARLTQIMVLKRIAGFVVIVVGGALVLLQFEALRAVGTSLLASAGVAGIVVGLAAQRSIATLLAGLQISLTQPVRVGDVVVIEGEWGTIEEITLTYVVVRVWDLRRLVVPITKILDAPFQNWTRSGSEILGTVFLHADYRLPVNEVRRELERFVATRPEWDGKVVGLQVTNATDRTVELRALVSSADASRNWDLRCAVREHLLAFLQRLDGGAYLPRTRVEASGLHPVRNVVAATAAPATNPDDSRKSGAQFDKTYMAMMVKDHAKDVNEVQNAATQAEQHKHMQLATGLSKAQETIEEHLQQARDVQRSLGGSPQARGASSAEGDTGSAAGSSSAGGAGGSSGSGG
jgi:small-conductance mechanosensitive channel